LTLLKSDFYARILSKLNFSNPQTMGKNNLMPRNKEQIMGFWLNEPAILDHEKIRRGVSELAEAGYGIIRIMLRNSNFSHRSPEVVAAVAVAVETAHRGGVKVVYDSEPHRMIASDMGGEFPDGIGSRLVRAEAQLIDGWFKLHVTCPNCMAEHPIFTCVEAAFIEIDGETRPLKNFTYELAWEKSTYDDGHTVYQQDYRDNSNIAMKRHVQLSGCLPEFPAGRLIVYANFRDNEQVDFAADGFKAYYRDLVDRFRDVPLDGVCWDEPAISGDWTHYRYGDAFAEFFEKCNGYQLMDRLYLLDAQDLTPEAVAVRLDYYRSLNEALFEAQKDFIGYAESVFGKKLLLGTHHTWQGEGGPNDYRAGAVNYFRLNDNMDAGYTDCCWWDQKSVAYSYILGSSLGRLTPSGECECNTWHWKPTNTQIQFNARLMSLMNITWFNIWYGDNADTCMYPSHYTWNTAVSAMQQHRDVQLLLQDAKPVVEVAVLHDWKSVTGINKTTVANLHKAFCLNLSKSAIDNNLAFDFIDDRLLSSAQIEDGKLCCALGRYTTLVLPFATVIDDASWKLIKAFIGANGKVIFCGPAPELTVSGQTIAAEFAELMGIAEIPLAKYLSWFDNSCNHLPKGRPDRFDPAYPVTGTAENVLISSEDEPCGARNANGNALYLSGFEASEPVLKQLQSWSNPAVRCYSDSVLFRLYQDADRQILALAARDGKELTGIVQFADSALLFEAGESACLSLSGSGELTVSGPGVKYRKLAATL
jgi:hypothetical protein